MILKDLTSNIYGKLTVINRADNKNKKVFWNCVCECGNTKTISRDSLMSGGTDNCGCLAHERRSKSKTKHGKSVRTKTTKEYRAWVKLKSRCYIKSDTGYKRYGARGIKVCDRWINSFVNFSLDMGKCPSKYHSIDRVDNNGDYSPQNCRWATVSEQANNRRNNRIVEFNGLKMTCAQWERHLLLPHHVVSKRLYYGWSIEEALTRKPKTYQLAMGK